MFNGQKVSFSGIQPSGNLTIGNYLGALKNFSSYSEQYKCFYCVVDSHAITVRQVPAELRRRTYETLALYMAAGLDPQVTLVTAHVPAICNHGGFAAGGDSGWPHYQTTPAYRKNPEAVLKASAYIDGVNFARNIKARVLVTTGFIDRTCPPESVFAAFNVIPSARKELFCTPGANHRVPDVARNAAEKVWADHIKTGR